jgi:hypothetical protein
MERRHQHRAERQLLLLACRRTSHDRPGQRRIDRLDPCKLRVDRKRRDHPLSRRKGRSNVDDTDAGCRVGEAQDPRQRCCSRSHRIAGGGETAVGHAGCGGEDHEHGSPEALGTTVGGCRRRCIPRLARSRLHHRRNPHDRWRIVARARNVWFRELRSSGDSCSVLGPRPKPPGSCC